MSVNDGALPLGRARIALGIVFLLRTTPLLAPLHISFLADAQPLLAWPDGNVHFAPTIPALPATWLAVLCVLRTVAAVAFTLGMGARPAGWLAGALGYLTVLQDPARFFTTHHVIFLGTMLLASTDATAACALRPTQLTSLDSSLRLLRTWVASIYLCAGIAKLRPDWLDGRTVALFAREGLIRPFVASTLLGTPVSRAAASTTVMVVEWLLGPLLLLSRTRRVGLFVAVFLHLGLEWAVSPDFFGWAMLALLMVFGSNSEQTLGVSHTEPTAVARGFRFFRKVIS